MVQLVYWLSYNLLTTLSNNKSHSSAANSLNTTLFSLRKTEEKSVSFQTYGMCRTTNVSWKLFITRWYTRPGCMYGGYIGGRQMPCMHAPATGAEHIDSHGSHTPVIKTHRTMFSWQRGEARACFVSSAVLECRSINTFSLIAKIITRAKD